MDRKSKVLAKIDSRKHSGVEIGALCWPVLSRNESKIKYIDYTSREGLIKDYKNEPTVNPEDIVDVDFVCRDKTLKAAVGGRKFDFVIASHVIEHVADVIGWLQQIQDILVEGGILSLVIPDKRYTFDINRRLTNTGDLVEQYFLKSTVPTPGQVYDFSSKYVEVDAKKAWENHDYSKSQPRSTPLESLNIVRETMATNSYANAHCHVFTPYSFTQILRELIEMELLGYEVSSFFTTEVNEYEFFVSLRKTKASKSRKLSSLPDVSTEKPVPEIDYLKKLAEKEKIIAEQKDRNLRLQRSLSMRLTKPLRAVKSKLVRP